MRRLISGTDEPPVQDILEKTNIMNVLTTIFKFHDSNDDVKNMKLEAVWILTNLVYGPPKEIAPIFDT